MLLVRNVLRCLKHRVIQTVRLLKVDWISSLRVNARLPLAQFVKMPILVYGCKIDSLKGHIEIRDKHVTFGMVRLGLKTSGMCGKVNAINLDIKGTLIFDGPGYMGNNSAIEIDNHGKIEFGRNFGITGSFRIASRKFIQIGNNFSASWNTGVFDTDFHNLVDVTTGKAEIPDKKVFIGNDVWMCQGAIVLKGTMLPDRSIVAACSLANKDYSKYPKNTIYAGIPAKAIKYDITRSEFIDFENHPIDNITRFLNL